MKSNIRELEYVIAGSNLRQVEYNTAIVGVGKETLRIARVNLLEDKFMSAQVAEISPDVSRKGRNSVFHLIGSVLVEKPYDCTTGDAPYGLRLITNATGEMAQRAFKELGDQLGLPVPDTIRSKEYYDLS